MLLKLLSLQKNTILKHGIVLFKNLMKKYFASMLCIPLAFTISLGLGVHLSHADTVYQAQSAAEVKTNPASLIIIKADWCSTCKIQKEALGKLLPSYKNLKVYVVDFDKQKDVLHTLGVNVQSTLIAYKNGKEVDRVVGETRADALQKILDKTL